MVRHTRSGAAARAEIVRQTRLRTTALIDQKSDATGRLYARSHVEPGRGPESNTPPSSPRLDQERAREILGSSCEAAHIQAE
jgi:hypothetical protein